MWAGRDLGNHKGCPYTESAGAAIGAFVPACADWARTTVTPTRNPSALRSTVCAGMLGGATTRVASTRCHSQLIGAFLADLLPDRVRDAAGRGGAEACGLGLESGA